MNERNKHERVYYHSVRKLLFKMASNAVDRFGMERNEALSEAYIAYRKALDSYDPESGTKFSTWVYTKVRYHFMELSRTDQRRNERCALLTDDAEMEIEDRTYDQFHFPDLSDEAKFVIKLVIDSPKELYQRILKDPRPSQYKRHIKQYLLQHQWLRSEIDSVFAEIQGAF